MLPLEKAKLKKNEHHTSKFQTFTCDMELISRDCDMAAGITPGIPVPVSPETAGKIRQVKPKKVKKLTIWIKKLGDVTSGFCCQRLREN